MVCDTPEGVVLTVAAGRGAVGCAELLAESLDTPESVVLAVAAGRGAVGWAELLAESLDSAYRQLDS